MKSPLIVMLALLLNPLTIIPIVHEITEIEAIVPYINKEKGPCTIVAFDIDDTLLKGTNEKATQAWFDEKIEEYTAMGLTTEQAIKRILPENLAAHHNTHVEAIDIDAEALINALKKKNIHVVALSARGLDFADITLRQLHDININLTPRKPINNNWQRCYILKINESKQGYYIPGIILSEGNDKGKVFEAFLRQLKYRPHKVIFVDDIRKNIDSVEQMCKRLGIKSQSFLITKTQKGIPAHSGERFLESTF